MKELLTLTHDWPEPIRQLILEGLAALERGDPASACRHLEQALRLEPNLPEAHLGLAFARRPGPHYRAWLKRLHDTLRPAVYIEIGIETGESLRLAQPPTCAIGIDPAPQVDGITWPTETRIHATPSNRFFEDADCVASLPGPVNFAFIDGDHRFEAVLRDIAHLEPLMAPDGVIALHDTFPLNALTADPVRQTGFYSGDGWKAVLCLRAVRPDIQVLTIPTAPTGLTLLTSFDPASRLLQHRLPALLEAYAPLPYRALAAAPGRLLGLTANEDSALDQLLARRPITTAKSSTDRPLARR
jgi:hypothetical protein